MARINGQLSQNVETNSKPIARHEYKVKNLSKMINILRNNLYKHKIRTLVQEYICNARDALREKYKDEVLKEMPELNPKKENNTRERELKLRAEVNKRIKNKDIIISFPTEMDPFFKVRDFGVGLSPERVAEVFTYYCESTKNESELETGGFGIGAKSAWAYTDHFQVVSFFNGKKYIYSSHTEVAEGILDLDAVLDTTEANGVEIIVAVNPSDIKQFANAIYRICFFWDTKPSFHGVSLADQPKWFEAKPDLQGENWSFYYSGKNSDFNHNKLFADGHCNYVINLDGVPFSETKSTALKELGLDGGLLVYKAPIGVLDIIASREELAKTRENMAHLHSSDLGVDCLKELITDLRDQDLRTKGFKEKYDFHTKIINQFTKDWMLKKYPEFFRLINEDNYNYKLNEYGSSNDQQYNFFYNFKGNKDCLTIVNKTRYSESTVSFLEYDHRRTGFNLRNKESIFAPFLIQDEFLSKKNRRLKCMEFAKNSTRRIILIELDDVDLIKSLRKDPLFFFTSDIPLVEKERKEIQRAKGVYTLQRVNLKGNVTKEKFQKPKDFFDSIQVPYLLMEEDAYRYDLRTSIKELNSLRCEVFTAAPTTIRNLLEKPKVYLYKDFVQNLEENLPLKEIDKAFIYTQYFKSLQSILENTYSNFFLTNNEGTVLLDLLKDKELSDELKQGKEFLELTKKINSELTLSFYESKYPKTCAEIKKNTKYTKAFEVLNEKISTYPLIKTSATKELIQELIFYMNAKAPTKKEKK